MKHLNRRILATCIVLGILSLNGSSKISNIDLTQVDKMSESANLFKSGDFFFAGQPSFELLKKLKKDGVTTIINLRSMEEITQFIQTGYDEEQRSKEMGLNYYNLPLRTKEDYSPEFLSEFAQIIENNDGKILIHCASCGRVSNVMIAYLIQYYNVAPKLAFTFGEKLKYIPWVELLLHDPLFH